MKKTVLVKINIDDFLSYFDDNTAVIVREALTKAFLPKTEVKGEYILDYFYMDAELC